MQRKSFNDKKNTRDNFKSGLEKSTDHSPESINTGPGNVKKSKLQCCFSEI